MKYGVITLSILLLLSLGYLGYNTYNYSIQNNKTKEINSKIDEVSNEIDKIDKYLEDNKTSYDDFMENNKTKIEVYEKWLRMQKEVEEAL